MVGRRHVNDLYIPVVEQRLIAAVSLAGPKRLSFSTARLFRAAGDRDDVHVAETSDRIDMMRAHEPCADEPHPDSFHLAGAPRPARPRSLAGAPSPRAARSSLRSSHAEQHFHRQLIQPFVAESFRGQRLPVERGRQ